MKDALVQGFEDIRDLFESHLCKSFFRRDPRGSFINSSIVYNLWEQGYIDEIIPRTIESLTTPNLMFLTRIPTLSRIRI